MDDECPPWRYGPLVAIVPGICEDCGAVFGAEVLSGAKGRNIRLGGAQVGPCPFCGGTGLVPEGTYDLIDNTLRTVRSADIDKTALNALIVLLEDRIHGRATDDEVIAQVEVEAPGLAPTVRAYLAKEPVSWLALLVSILLWALSPSPPSAEEVADAVWAKDHTRQTSKPLLSRPVTKAREASEESPRAHGKGEQHRGRRHR